MKPIDIEEKNTFILDTNTHIIGDKECDGCWNGYPIPCDADGCDGLIHGEYFDENYDKIILVYRCDKCGGD